MSDKQNLLDRPFFAWLLASLIVFSVLCFSLETVPGLSPATMKFLHWAELITVLIFTIEYIYRILSAEDRFKYIFSFYGIIDLCAILPFYLATSIDLRSIRLFRLLRLGRLLKLARYNSAIRRFGIALKIAREELSIFGIASLMILYLSAVGIYYFEHDVQPENFRSIFDCLWWAVATLTTVGYGDVYPVTVGGRIFTFLVLLVGLGLVAVPTGIVASALSKARTIE